MTQNNEISIFLSHKARDYEAAKAIKQIFKDHSGRLDVHIFEEQTAGEPWQDWIRNTLRQSNLLLLLYTDPTAEWDWCLFEAGWFTPLRSEDTAYRVVCLYSPECSEPPKPLTSLVAVRAEKEDLVAKFLRPLFKTRDLVHVDEVLNPDISDKALEQMADGIAAQFSPVKIDQRYYQERIMVELSDLSFLENGEPHIPGSSKVEVLGSRWEILDYDETRFTWNELLEQAEGTKGYGTFWIDEIERVIIAAARKKKPSVPTATFRQQKGGRIYRPILYRVERENRTPRRFYFAFIEEIEPELVGGRGEEGDAFNLIRIGSRIRWEVIEPFSKRVRRATTPQDLAIVARQLIESIEAIEIEAQRHGHLDKERIWSLFSAQERDVVEKMMNEWEEIRCTLVEELAESEPDQEALRTALEAMRRMNRDYMALVAGKYYRALESERLEADVRVPMPEDVAA